MGRNWSPKGKFRCSMCKWSGIRTLKLHKPCPKCGARPSSLNRVAEKEGK